MLAGSTPRLARYLLAATVVSFVAVLARDGFGLGFPWWEAGWSKTYNLAELLIKRNVLIQNLRVEPEGLAYHYGIANIGGFLSGVNNNGLHSANAITAMFIATGQDVANVSESSAGILYAELTAEKDLYLSLTIPSLIVATYGGGTNLATQHECLEILGCVGKGTVNKLAEIVAGVALAGEISLGAAISSSDWVSSHEKYGRNR